MSAPASNGDVSVRPLMCSGCGAALALGTGATSRCPFCRNETPVPSEYRALQRAAQAFIENRELAAQLYEDLGTPPGWFFRTWASAAKGSGGLLVRLGAILVVLMGNPFIGLPFVMAAAWVLGFPVAAVVRAINESLGYPPGPITPYLILPVTVGVCVLLIGVPLLLAGRNRAIGRVRAGVQASLAAKPPTHPGGPSCCWNCDAALDVAPGLLGVPCVYCKSDNLVALSPQWVATARARELTHFTGVATARDAFRRAKRKARDAAWKMVFWLFLSVPLIIGLAALMEAFEVFF